jgi:hypothetical protein
MLNVGLPAVLDDIVERADGDDRQTHT